MFSSTPVLSPLSLYKFPNIAAAHVSDNPLLVKKFQIISALLDPLKLPSIDFELELDAFFCNV